jgi:hypothetical protein
MKRDQNKILLNPTKKVVKIVFIAWLIGTMLMVLAMTDLFRMSFFNKKYLVAYFLLLSSTGTLIVVCINYLKTARAVR